MRPRLHRLLPLLALPLLAQQGAAVFQHFRHYPAGQWSTETSVSGGNLPQTAPMVTTACASPLSPARREALVKLGNDAAPASCKVTVLHDEESIAESVQVCTGAPVQTIRTTLHAIDNTTVTTDVRSSIPGQPDTVAHATSHYLGVCTASEQSAADAAVIPSFKPDAGACAQFADSRKQAEEALRNCESGDFPDDERVRCRSTMSALVQRVEKLQQSCAR